MWHQSIRHPTCYIHNYLTYVDSSARLSLFSDKVCHRTWTRHLSTFETLHTHTYVPTYIIPFMYPIIQDCGGGERGLSTHVARVEQKCQNLFIGIIPLCCDISPFYLTLALQKAWYLSDSAKKHYLCTQVAQNLALFRCIQCKYNSVSFIQHGGAP